jgi:hypothetical protein
MRQTRMKRKREATAMPKVMKKRKNPAKRRRPRSKKRVDVNITLFK